jgi:magnesium-transporting ATPase (P-type)
VLRDGVWSTVTSRELVPGGIIRVRSGDFVPADVKIITAGAEPEVDWRVLTYTQKIRGNSLLRIDNQKRRNNFI